MAYEWFASAFQRYLSTMELSQRRLLDAQQDACLSWTAAWLPGYPLADADLQGRIDGSLLGGVSLLQAQADNQRDLMLATEKSLNDMHRRLLQQLEQSGNHPSFSVMKQALQLGQSSGSAVSKMSRQVGHFAATSFSSASLNAARDMRRVWRRQKP
ncbi:MULTISPECIES: hypothetical protein [Aquitalea]|jgi:hypothetical protein|uniref:hypothetical protein n=1 Tax=Aquitalea TaxID=407217 RepID=UPI0013567CC5|nr:MULTISPECIES: hypothetical protein [Aquitalea]